MLKNFFNKVLLSFKGEKQIAPLAVLRMAFGAIMLISTVRFILKGWVYDFYIAPKFYFPFYGFEWVKPLPATMMYIVFGLMVIASLFILIGFFYRISITTFFICFVYTELIDKTYYLNHYYFVSIITFLLLLVPAHRYFSVDVIRRPSIKVTQVPSWTINIFKWQLLVIYFCAGLSKLNYDWMVQAMPLKLWLPANAGLPLIGPLLTQTWVAYLFSWFGAIFDLSIGFLLLSKTTRKTAYIFVVIFHVFTGWLFKIGMFPYIMIFVTVIFFSEAFHLRLIQWLSGIFNKRSAQTEDVPARLVFSPLKKKLLYSLLSVYILLQIILPLRFLLYPGTLFWTEEGYRFSWRVMLMEKGGTTFFYVKDPATGRKGEVINEDYLTPLQEKMMETQPDMMLQYAHYLSNEYKKKGIKDPVVTVESYVTLNGSSNQLYIDSTVDLSKEKENFLPKKWILPFKKD
ncbi:MAG TPA: HTTM domain-containing protein [Ferruginibacter sp.]|nr:HTTM domain-containing protein [Ferruginibacter sp.]